MENKHTQQVDFSNPNVDKITSGTTNKLLENKHTAMQQLLAQLKDERTKLPMLIEWDRCYQAIEMVIQNAYEEGYNRAVKVIEDATKINLNKD